MKLTKERVSDFENRATEIIHSEERGKRLKKINRNCGIYKYWRVKHTVTYISQEGKMGKEKTFEVIMTKISQTRWKEVNLQI